MSLTITSVFILYLFLWEMIMRLNFMRSKFAFFMRSQLQSWDRNYNNEIKIPFVLEIETYNNIDQEVDTSIMRSKPKKALLATFDLMIILVTNKSIMRSKLKKALLGNFNLINNLLVTSAIMRSKVFMHRWLIIRAKN